MPWPRIIEAQGRALLPLLTEMARMPFHPCVDGELLTQRPVDALAAGVGAAVDLVVGTTEDEMRLFLMEPSLVEVQMRKRVDRYLGRDGADVVDAYRGIVGDDPMDVWAAIFTDREMLLPALAVADAHRGATWRYLFTWPVAPRADGLRAAVLSRRRPAVHVRRPRPARVVGVDRRRGPARCRVGARRDDDRRVVPVRGGRRPGVAASTRRARSRCSVRSASSPMTRRLARRAVWAQP